MPLSSRVWKSPSTGLLTAPRHEEVRGSGNQKRKKDEQGVRSSSSLSGTCPLASNLPLNSAFISPRVPLKVIDGKAKRISPVGIRTGLTIAAGGTSHVKGCLGVLGLLFGVTARGPEICKSLPSFLWWFLI